MNKPINPSPIKDDIDRLGLNIRCRNALKRAHIQTIEELLDATRDGQLTSIFGLGIKNISEIRQKLQQIHPQNEHRDPRESAIQILGNIHELNIGSINRQLSRGLIHGQATIVGKPISEWLQPSDPTDQYHACFITSLLANTVFNICDELEFIINNFPPVYIKILLFRYGYIPITLEESSSKLSLSRERVRQLANKIKEKIHNEILKITINKNITGSNNNIFFIRIQSALLFARDMGLDITWANWRQSLYSSGLLGEWSSDSYSHIDPIELMYAICNAVGENSIQELSLPPNLVCIINSRINETSNKSARVIESLRNLPKEVKREIKRHCQYSGGVNARWLSNNFNYKFPYIIDILEGLKYKPITKDWYILESVVNHSILDKNQVFHHSLRKMFQYCGPLPIDDICSGIRHSVSRTEYPVPPVPVMQEILLTTGYIFSEGKYSFPGNIHEELSTGEELIIKCLQENGKVVHHTELAQTFIDSKLSFPSLHATLKRSPIFDRFNTGLYKLKGSNITHDDIQRAQSLAERIPVNLEVNYEKSGAITVKATLGIFALATGTLYCEQLPNLSGEWNCYVNNKFIGIMIVTENEFRQISLPANQLRCQVGSRLNFIFNTWDRAVRVSIAGKP